MKKVCMVLVLGMMVFVAGSAVAQATVTLPDVGFDVADFVTAGIVAIGGAVAAVVGGFFSFKAVKAVMRWAGWL